MWILKADRMIDLDSYFLLYLEQMSMTYCFGSIGNLLQDQKFSSQIPLKFFLHLFCYYSSEYFISNSIYILEAQKMQRDCQQYFSDVHRGIYGQLIASQHTNFGEMHRNQTKNRRLYKQLCLGIVDAKENQQWLQNQSMNRKSKYLNIIKSNKNQIKSLININQQQKSKLKSIMQQIKQITKQNHLAEQNLKLRGKKAQKIVEDLKIDQSQNSKQKKELEGLIEEQKVCINIKQNQKILLAQKATALKNQIESFKLIKGKLANSEQKKKQLKQYLTELKRLKSQFQLKNLAMKSNYKSTLTNYQHTKLKSQLLQKQLQDLNNKLQQENCQSLNYKKTKSQRAFNISTMKQNMIKLQEKIKDTTKNCQQYQIQQNKQLKLSIDKQVKIKMLELRLKHVQMQKQKEQQNKENLKKHYQQICQADKKIIKRIKGQALQILMNLR